MIFYKYELIIFYLLLLRGVQQDIYLFTDMFLRYAFIISVFCFCNVSAQEKTSCNAKCNETKLVPFENLTESAQNDVIFKDQRLKALYLATLAPDREEALRKMNDGADPSAKITVKGCGMSLVHLVVSRRQEYALEMLGSLGADLYATNCHAETPMHVAIKGDMYGMIRALLRAGYSPNIGSAKRGKPLSFALNKQKFRIASQLIKAGADPFSRCLDGDTYFHKAVRNGKLGTVVFLVKEGVGVDVTNAKNETPLYIATQRNDATMVNALLTRGANRNRRLLKGNTYLHLAVASKSPAIVEILLNQGTDVNQKNDLNETPLDIAMKTGDEALVHLLLQRGSNPKGPFPNGNTYLHWAVVHNNVALLKALLKNGAHVDVLNERKESPLYLAVELDRKEIAICLLEKGANPNLKLDKGSYLHIAVMKESFSVLEPLLEHGASVNSVNADAETALQLAVKNNRVEAVRILAGKGANLELEDYNDYDRKPLQQAAYYGHMGVARALIFAGADVNGRSRKYGATPLYDAVVAKRVDMVKFLLTSGADPNIPTNVGFTPLAEATRMGLYDIVEVLLFNKAFVNKRTKEGHTPLFIARANKQIKIVELLEAHGGTI